MGAGGLGGVLCSALKTPGACDDAIQASPVRGARESRSAVSAAPGCGQAPFCPVDQSRRPTQVRERRACASSSSASDNSIGLVARQLESCSRPRLRARASGNGGPPRLCRAGRSSPSSIGRSSSRPQSGGGGPIVAPDDQMESRSRALCNSRTFSGHEYCKSSDFTLAESLFFSYPGSPAVSLLMRSRSMSISKPMSPLRSLTGGRRRRPTKIL